MRDHRNRLAAAVSVLFAVGLTTAPTATADTCDNAALRAQNNSTALPDCRAYELVSSPFKGGFDVEPSAERFTDDGLVSYWSSGAFAGEQQGTLASRYLATRSEAGWVTAALAPPASIYDTRENTRQEESLDLRWSLWEMLRRDVSGDKYGYWLRGPDGTFTRIGDIDSPFGSPAYIRASSDDLSHIVFNYATVDVGTALWEYVGTGNEDFARRVSVHNDGQFMGGATCANDVSRDGRVIVYTITGVCTSPIPLLVFARVAGSATVAVSGSECTRTVNDPGGACNAFSGAAYAGSADDGSRVFVTTSQQLVNGDIDAGNDLYACDIPAGVPAPVGAANRCETLTEVTGSATDAKVESVLAVSKDGSRVYFTAQGVLADNLGVDGVGPASSVDFPFGGEPHNLYMWERDGADPAGQTRFVARLADNDLSRPQLTPDGRYLLFSTASKLVTGGPGADTDDEVDAYRYDASTHSIVRVSTSVAGSGGNSPGFDVSTAVGASMSADGSTVVFDTAEALSVADTDGVADVYSWRGGQVSLISAGDGNSIGISSLGRDLGISSSGRDIFFLTDAQVIAADGDANRDIYTARVGGGFARPQSASCSGDGCQGLLSDAPGLAGPRSGSPGDSDPGDGAAVLSLRAVTAAQRRRLAATGKLSLTVAANRAGQVSAMARAKIGGRSVTVGSGRRTMTRPGSVTVGLKLSRKARAQLAARGRVTVKVVVSHSKASRGRSVTLRLTRARASRSSVGGRS